MKLVNIFFYLYFGYLCRAKYLLVFISITLYLITSSFMISLQLTLLVVLYVCVHEIGHIIFLKTNNLNYEVYISSYLISVSFDSLDYSKLNKINKLTIVLGGPFLSYLLLMVILFLFSSIDYIFNMVILLLFCETLNLFCAQDGRMLMNIIKEEEEI